MFFREAVTAGESYDEVKILAEEKSIVMPTRKLLLESQVTEGILTKIVEVHTLGEKY